MFARRTLEIIGQAETKFFFPQKAKESLILIFYFSSNKGEFARRHIQVLMESWITLIIVSPVSSASLKQLSC